VAQRHVVGEGAEIAAHRGEASDCQISADLSKNTRLRFCRVTQRWAA
jgi:hypothetical protein